MTEQPTGGILISIELAGGPLDGIRLGLHLTALDDLPRELSAAGGAYERWLNADGGQMRTSGGEPLYRWAAAA